MKFTARQNWQAERHEIWRTRRPYRTKSGLPPAEERRRAALALLNKSKRTNRATVYKAEDASLAHKEAVCRVCKRPFWYHLSRLHNAGKPPLACSKRCRAGWQRAKVRSAAAQRWGEDPDKPFEQLRPRNPKRGRATRLASHRVANERHRRRRLTALADRIANRTATADDFKRVSWHSVQLALLALHTMSDIFTPEEATKLRAKIARIVTTNMTRADLVLSGRETWSNQQVAVFKALLGKVVPDLSASFNVHERREVDLTQLSQEELARIAMGDSQLTISTPKHRLPVIIEDAQTDVEEQRQEPDPIDPQP